jgi:hypothetical protein
MKGRTGTRDAIHIERGLHHRGAAAFTQSTFKDNSGQNGKLRRKPLAPHAVAVEF